MADLKQSYLIAFDPLETGEAFGFMRAKVSGRDQWWLVQVWAEEDPQETVMVRFLEQDGPGRELVDYADNHTGRPWYPIPWISDDIPRRCSPSFRLNLDMPRGCRVTHEWGPGPMDDTGRKMVEQMLDRIYGGMVDG